LKDKEVAVAFRVSKRDAEDIRMLTYVLGYVNRSDFLREILQRAIRQLKEEFLIEQNSGELSQLLGMEKESRKLFLEG
jgi:metal-responsive CopG/Arc/MetJ family transcriptional regulator